jgi:type I restriction enzyme M protein
MSDQLSGKLWEAFDLLRGEAGIQIGFDVVSGLLLLKLASDQPALLNVPPAARWDVIAGSASPVDALTEALRALKSANPESIGTANTALELPTGLKPQTARSLLDLFNQVNLKRDTLKHGAVVGQDFDEIQHRFADDSGKSGGDFAPLPAFLSRLMVRLADLSPEQTVYDPFAKNGSLLVAASTYVTDRYGPGAAVDLVGQTFNMAICDRDRINLLLHSIPEFSLHHSDALYNPLLDEKGQWRRFDRVLANPPFSMKYRPQDITSPERMQYGWTSERGNNADLMVLQHVLASLKPDGVGVVVAPAGVLFRSGPEGTIRKNIVDDGRIEAIIGLGSNLLYATSIPICILIVRGPRESSLQQPPPGTDSILFVDAGHELSRARGKRHIEAEVVEKIVSSVRRHVSIPGFSRNVLIDEIAANRFSLNISQYVTTSSSRGAAPDIRGTLFGGIPRAEVDAEMPRFLALGVEVSDMFELSEGDYLTFLPEDFDTTVARIEERSSEAEASFGGHCRSVWESIASEFEQCLFDGNLMELYGELADSFVSELRVAGVLETYESLGVWAWWLSDHESDLRYLIEHLPDEALRPGELDLQVPNESKHAPSSVIERVLAALGDDLCHKATFRASIKRRELPSIFRAWAARYGTSLRDLETERDLRSAALEAKLRSMGFRPPAQGGA